MHRIGRYYIIISNKVQYVLLSYGITQILRVDIRLDWFLLINISFIYNSQLPYNHYKRIIIFKNA